MRNGLFNFLVKTGLPLLILFMLLVGMGVYLQHHGHLIPTYNQ